jgi:hypothetical protein
MVIKRLIIRIFSRFNTVDLLHSMLADCCMLRCREWGPITAVGRRRPPLSIDAFFACCRNRLLNLLFLLLRHHRRHTSCRHNVPASSTRRNERFGVEAAEPTASDLAWMHFITSSGGYRRLCGMLRYVFLRRTQPTTTKKGHQRVVT